MGPPQRKKKKNKTKEKIVGKNRKKQPRRIND